MHLGVGWLASMVLLCLTDKGIAIPDCLKSFALARCANRLFPALDSHAPYKIQASASDEEMTTHHGLFFAFLLGIFLSAF